MKYLHIQNDGSAELNNSFEDETDGMAVIDGDLQVFKIDGEKVFQAKGELVAGEDEDADEVASITWELL